MFFIIMTNAAQNHHSIKRLDSEQSAGRPIRVLWSENKKLSSVTFHTSAVLWSDCETVFGCAVTNTRQKNDLLRFLTERPIAF